MSHAATTRRPRPGPAFSLVEVLVVAAIVALLLALLLPALAKARRSADRTTCASNLRQVGQLLYLYANDNKGEIPAAYARWPIDVAPPDDPLLGVTTSLAEFVAPRTGGVALLVRPPIGAGRPGYVDGARPFHCPGDYAHAPHRPTEDGWGRASGDVDGGRMSYRYTYVPPGGNQWSTGRRRASWRPGAFAGFERHNVRQKNAESLSVMYDIYPMFGVDDDHQAEWNDGFHGDGRNVLYLDGHVTWILTSAVDAEVREAVKAGGHSPATTWISTLDRHAGG